MGLHYETPRDIVRHRKQFILFFKPQFVSSILGIKLIFVKFITPRFAYYSLIVWII